MNTWPLNNREEENLGVLREAGVEVVLVFITKTGLKKSILDATLPLRTLLAEHGIHDFSTQGKGRAAHGVSLIVKFVSDDAIRSVLTSLYRPETKDGDPRFWPSRLSRFADANDVFAAFAHDGTLYLLNLSRSRLSADRAAGRRSEALALIEEIAQGENAIADELLGRLRELAERGPIRSVGSGSMAVGRSIEHALGIPANSSPWPDYRGIEIKSGRGTVDRSQLFAQVPDWSLSPCSSSMAILQKCGYVRNGRLQLYCEMRTNHTNSQGLRLRVIQVPPWLVEYLDLRPREDVAVWPLDLLHRRFIEKHRETFWITAPAVSFRRMEHFRLQSVTHTRRPSITQFDQLLLEGAISVDHLCRLKGRAAAERGPLFKVDKDRRAELFTGPPRQFRLDG